MNMEIFLWFAGMWFLGGILYTMFGLQIAITKRCAMKLQVLLESNPANWYPEASRKYWNGVVWKNRIILWVIAAVIICFVPKIGALGYLVGIACKWLFTGSASGLNTNNLQDAKNIFLRFAKPGQEAEFNRDIDQAIDALANNQLMRYV